MNSTALLKQCSTPHLASLFSLLGALAPIRRPPVAYFGESGRPAETVFGIFPWGSGPPLPAKLVFEATGRATSRRLWGACGNNPCFVSQTSPCEGLCPALVFGYVLGMKNPQRGAGDFGAF